MATTVVCDYTETALPQVNHLCVPGVRVQRPAMGKNNRLSVAPILVVNRGSVLHGDGICGGLLCGHRTHDVLLVLVRVTAEIRSAMLADEFLLSAVFRAWAVTASTALDGAGRKLLQGKQRCGWKNGKGQVEDGA